MDVRQEITNKIIAAIERGAGDFIMPWRRSAVGAPRNALTKKDYRGVNPILLSITAASAAYCSPEWATYKQ